MQKEWEDHSLVELCIDGKVPEGVVLPEVRQVQGSLTSNAKDQAEQASLNIDGSNIGYDVLR